MVVKIYSTAGDDHLLYCWLHSSFGHFPFASRPFASTTCPKEGVKLSKAFCMRGGGVKDLCICLRTVEKSLGALEESLFTKVAVEKGEEDEGEPDDHDQPELLVGVHLVPDRARLHVCRTKLCALQNPLAEVADHSVVIHLEDKIRAVDDPSHGEERDIVHLKARAVCRQHTNCARGFPLSMRKLLSHPTPACDVREMSEE